MVTRNKLPEFWEEERIGKVKKKKKVTKIKMTLSI